MRALGSYDGSPLTKAATKLLMLTGVRTLELRAARWEEFDLTGALWSVDPERMKKRRPHLVPLSKQAVAVLHEVRALTGYGALLFPNRNNPLEPMSDAAVNKVIALLGYKGRLTGHGFRHTMSTILCNGLIKQDTLIGSIYTASRGVYESNKVHEKADLQFSI